MHPYAIAPMSMHPAITEVTLMIIMSVDVRLLSSSATSSPPLAYTANNNVQLFYVFFPDIMFFAPSVTFSKAPSVINTPWSFYGILPFHGIFRGFSGKSYAVKMVKSRNIVEVRGIAFVGIKESKLHTCTFSHLPTYPIVQSKM